ADRSRDAPDAARPPHARIHGARSQPDLCRDEPEFRLDRAAAVDCRSAGEPDARDAAAGAARARRAAAGNSRADSTPVWRTGAGDDATGSGAHDIVAACANPAGRWTADP